MDHEMDFDIGITLDTDAKPSCHLTAGQKAVAALPNLQERLIQKRLIKRRDQERSRRIRMFLEQLLK